MALLSPRVMRRSRHIYKEIAIACYPAMPCLDGKNPDRHSNQLFQDDHSDIPPVYEVTQSLRQLDIPGHSER
jgi:hypothetical protein